MNNDIHAPRRTAVYNDVKPGVPGNVHCSLWKSIPIDNCAGNKAEFIDVSTGIRRDKVYTVHASSCPGRPNEGIQGQESSIIKSLLTRNNFIHK